jgi:hypothetical protein
MALTIDSERFDDVENTDLETSHTSSVERAHAPLDGRQRYVRTRANKLLGPAIVAAALSGCVGDEGAKITEPKDTTTIPENCPKDKPEQCVAAYGKIGDVTLDTPTVDPDSESPQITRFVPRAYYGSAPFKTEILFDVESPTDSELSCEFDAEGDGKFEQKPDCADGVLPVSYAIPGRYNPTLRVTDANGNKTTISEMLMSNKLVPKANTILVDEMPDLKERSVEGDIVTLRFSSSEKVPTIADDSILLDRGLNGYVRKVTEITKDGDTLQIQTVEKPIYDAFESGYFGMRYPKVVKLDPASETEVENVSGRISVQALPGDVNLGQIKNEIHIPLATSYKLDIPVIESVGKAEVALENPTLDVMFNMDYFEISVAARYLHVGGLSEIVFDTGISISGDTYVNNSVFIQIGPLGVGVDTPLGKLAFGAVVEVGLQTEASIDVGWHQNIDSYSSMDMIYSDPLVPDWAKGMMGYPQNQASVNGIPKFTTTDINANFELDGKLFISPQVVLSIGNAAGVMQRAKKDKAKYDTECKKFNGIRIATGLETNLSVSGNIGSDSDGALCLEVERDALLFAELFPGFGFCPSIELSPLDDSSRLLSRKCFCESTVDSVVTGESVHVGNIVKFDVNGTCFLPGTTQDAISVTISDCEMLYVREYTDKKVSYQCVPMEEGELIGTVKGYNGNTLFNFVVEVLPEEGGEGGSGGEGGAENGGSSGENGGTGGNINNDGSAGSENEKNVTAIAAHYDQTCAVINGGVQCWGLGAYGQLGNNSQNNSSVPVQVEGLTSGVTAIATGRYHTCAIVNGGVQCWGCNDQGQLGNNSTINSSVPVQVQGLTVDVTAIATRGNSSCAVVNSGAQCWGYNDQGQLGNNSTINSSVPVQVQGLTGGVTAIATGNHYTCAVINGGVQCWGCNSSEGGELGNNFMTDCSFVPVQVQGLTSGVTAIAAGEYHVCAVVDGGVQCWGNNEDRQLGNNSTMTNSSVPVQVQGLTSGVTAIVAGDLHTCVLVNGEMQCWGWNGAGQLGNNSTTGSSVPVDVQFP